MASKGIPLPLHDTLQDLALLRASSVDLSGLIADDTTSSQASKEAEGVEESTIQSYAFVREVRTALKMHNSGEAQNQATRIEKVQVELVDVLRSLSD
ncbi:uncharacterized protein F5891DRAFT_613454 [Suillus fuscotomentosus]|uniref:Uncharacterized protein n=1 Tax=Suillus fuscotomentosus TaxID=1912939 RepID=A0AAD4E035_9AGAM|nr:uncharacterized protein F5891DRAFT_613454 [Suillus fuscotomentosus]KAG1896014.1 hypothetical protein F5891DRAFT_613454 [Suillus fuscotomentosus]